MSSAKQLYVEQQISANALTFDGRDAANRSLANRDAIAREANERADRAISYCEVRGVAYGDVAEAVEIMTAGSTIRLM